MITLSNTQPTRNFLQKDSTIGYHQEGLLPSGSTDKKHLVCSIVLTLQVFSFLIIYWVYLKIVYGSCVGNILMKADLVYFQHGLRKILTCSCFARWLCQLKLITILGNHKQYIAWKVSVFGVFLASIFPYSDFFILPCWQISFKIINGEDAINAEVGKNLQS